MRNRCFIVGIFVGLLLAGTVNLTGLMAQEEEYDLAHTDVFGKLRRPSVHFAHDIHSDILSDTGCGVCHHVVDQNTGKLVYREGEELTCKECHTARKSADKPGLREAYHGSCTTCHRRLVQTNSEKTGPITCGECHKKP